MVAASKKLIPQEGLTVSDIVPCRPVTLLTLLNMYFFVSINEALEVLRTAFDRGGKRLLLKNHGVDQIENLDIPVNYLLMEVLSEKGIIADENSPRLEEFEEERKWIGIVGYNLTLERRVKFPRENPSLTPILKHWLGYFFRDYYREEGVRLEKDKYFPLRRLGDIVLDNVSLNITQELKKDLKHGLQSAISKLERVGIETGGLEELIYHPTFTIRAIQTANNERRALYLKFRHTIELIIKGYQREPTKGFGFPTIGAGAHSNYLYSLTEFLKNPYFER